MVSERVCDEGLSRAGRADGVLSVVDAGLDGSWDCIRVVGVEGELAERVDDDEHGLGIMEGQAERT